MLALRAWRWLSPSPGPSRRSGRLTDSLPHSLPLCDLVLPGGCACGGGINLTQKEGKEEICICSLAGILNAAFQLAAESLGRWQAGGWGTPLGTTRASAGDLHPAGGESQQPHSAQLARDWLRPAPVRTRWYQPPEFCGGCRLQARTVLRSAGLPATTDPFRSFPCSDRPVLQVGYLLLLLCGASKAPSGLAVRALESNCCQLLLQRRLWRAGGRGHTTLVLLRWLWTSCH